MEEKKIKQERTVIHLYLKENDLHQYFGSMANIFEYYKKEEIGIGFGSLRNYGLSSEKTYENKKVIIRKGILSAKPKKIKEHKENVNEKVKQKRIFNKKELEQYLSNIQIFPTKYFTKRYVFENADYEDLTNSIAKIKQLNNMYNISPDYSVVYTHILETLRKICNNDNEYNLYKKQFDNKLSKNKQYL